MSKTSQQAVRTTLISFIGIGVGAITRFTMPVVLTPEQIGVISLLDSTSAMLATIFSLGFMQVTLKIFPDFRAPNNGHNGFLSFALLVTLFGIILGLISFYFFESFIFGDKPGNKMIMSFAYLIFPLIAFRVLFKNLDIYLRMLYNPMIGIITEGFLLKLVLLIGIVIYALNLYSFESLLYVNLFAFCLPGIILLFTVLRHKNALGLPSAEFFTKPKRKNIIQLSSFGILAAASGVIIITVDQLMVNGMLGTAEVGVYATMFFAGTLVGVPARGIKRVAAPIIADAWHANNKEKVQNIYMKSATTNLISGGYLFIVGWACITPAISLLPESEIYATGLYVFFFIGLSQLVEMMAGVNAEIIAASEQYKVNTYFNVILAILIVILNFVFIKLYGLVGAALATAIALTIMNFGRWIYLKRKYGLQPFSKNFFVVFIMLTVYTLILSFINLPFGPIIQILIMFSVITLTYGVFILKFRMSEDINGWVNKIMLRFKR